MSDHPADLTSIEIGTIREHAAIASRLLAQVLRGIDEGAEDLLTACLRGVQPHLARLVQADTRLSAFLNVDPGCVAEGLTRHCKTPGKSVDIATLLRWRPYQSLPAGPCEIYRQRDAGHVKVAFMRDDEGRPMFRRTATSSLILPWGDARWSYPPSPAIPESALTGSPVRVWGWDHAPEALRALSRWGGGEDWIALVPPGVEVPSWVERLTVYGVQETVLDDGARVFVWARS